MIVPPLPAPLVAGPTAAPAADLTPAGESLASAFAGLLAVLTGASPPPPARGEVVGDLPPPQQPGPPERPASANSDGVLPLLASALPGQILPTPAPMAGATPESRQAIPRGGVLPTSPGGEAGLAQPGETVKSLQTTAGLVPAKQDATSDPARPAQFQPGATDDAALPLPTVHAEAADPQVLLTSGRSDASVPTGPTQTSAPPPTLPAHHAPPPASGQVHVQIARAATEHVDHIRVRLDPPELGHVEIKLHFGEENRFTAVVTVERGETLDLLQRDAAALERGLRDAGLRADGGGLSFTLRRDQQESTGGQQGGRPDPDGRWDGAASEPGAEAPVTELRLDALRMLDIRA